MRDATILTRLGVPVVQLITEHFWLMFDALLPRSGIPNLPGLEIPWPMAGTDDAYMRAVARLVAPDLIGIWSGVFAGSPRWNGRRAPER